MSYHKKNSFLYHHWLHNNMFYLCVWISSTIKLSLRLLFGCQAPFNSKIIWTYSNCFLRRWRIVSNKLSGKSLNMEIMIPDGNSQHVTNAFHLISSTSKLYSCLVFFQHTTLLMKCNPNMITFLAFCGLRKCDYRCRLIHFLFSFPWGICCCKMWHDKSRAVPVCSL